MCKDPGVRERSESGSVWLDHSGQQRRSFQREVATLKLSKVVNGDEFGKIGAGNGHTSKAY